MKTCLKCVREKTDAMFRRCDLNEDGKAHYCKTCEKEFPKKELFALGTRKCAKCNNFLPRTDFYIIDSKAGTIIKTICIPCWKQESKNKWQENIEDNRAKHRGAWGRFTEDERVKRRKKRVEKYRAQVNFYERIPEKIEQKKKEASQRATKTRMYQRIYKRIKTREIKEVYVIQLLSCQLGISHAELRALPQINEMIETKQLQLRIKRIVKNIKHEQQGTASSN